MFTLLTSVMCFSKILRSAYATIIKRMHFLQGNSSQKFSVIYLFAVAAQVAQLPVLLQLAAISALSLFFIMSDAFVCCCALVSAKISNSVRGSPCWFSSLKILQTSHSSWCS